MGETALLDAHPAINRSFSWGQVLLRCPSGGSRVRLQAREQGEALSSFPGRIGSRASPPGDVVTVRAGYQSFPLKWLETNIFVNHLRAPFTKAAVVKCHTDRYVLFLSHSPTLSDFSLFRKLGCLGSLRLCTSQEWVFFFHYYEKQCCLSAQTVGKI